jgi:prephenate dehydrogenase
LDEYIQNLEDFKQKLIDNNYEGIYQEMDNTNKIKSILKGIPQNNKDR